MVKLRLQPFGRLVTGSAVSAHAVLMRFIFRVTVNARRRCFAPFLVRLMTVVAGGVFVRTQQLEVRKAMIERGFIEYDDERIAADMLRVTGGALIGLYFGASSVESRFGFYIFGDLFMTVHAKLPLPTLVEALVAGRTFAFQVRVGTGHRTRHDQGFDILRRGVM